MDELLDLARTVGREAALYVAGVRPRGRVDVSATKSSPTDVVTAIDEECERLIRARILDARPDDSFQGEEGDDIHGSSDVEWIVDPIDGTVNFVYGLPFYAVSIAAAVNSEVAVGYVINIANNDEYTAIRGEGSFTYTEDGPLRLWAPVVERLDYALVATGFCYVNNSAIAAQRLRSTFDKVAILDVDQRVNLNQALFEAVEAILGPRCWSIDASGAPAVIAPRKWGPRSSS